MDGKTFVGKFTRILEKVSRMTKNCYDDVMIVSDDPDCDADYGVDANGNLIIDGYRTNLKLSELCDIRYRAKDGGWIDNKEEGYISLVFQNDMVFYLCFTWEHDLGDEIYWLKTNCYFFQNNVLIKNIIQAKDYDWKNPFVISDHKLVAYMGTEKEVIVPEGITEIGEDAFLHKKTDKVILPTTVQKIGRSAFCFSSLKEIDLAKVEVIGAGAFALSSIEHIILPETVKHIGDNALYDTQIASEQDIENHSNVAIDERIFRLRSKFR